MIDRASVALAAALFALVVIVALSAKSFVAGYAFQDDMIKAATATVTALLVTTLVVERGLAALNAILFGEPQRAAELKIAGTADEKKQGLKDLSVVFKYKERLRILGAFMAGLFVSAAGVRTLEGLLDTKAAGAAGNGYLFPVDVVLTAALIAGGSNGLAFLLQLLKDVSADANGNKNGAQNGASTRVRARLTTAG